MLPQLPHELALHPGPIASAYLDVSRDQEDAAHQVRLRWEALAGQLREQGADEKTLDAAGEAATEDHHQPGPAGRAVFAAEGRVLHVADLPGPPRRELARWAPLPDLLPLLAQLPEYVPHVVARLGRLTATITGVDRAGGEVLGVTDHGESHPVHKTRGGGAAHYSMQHRTEEIWARNTHNVAADIDRAVSNLHAELVVLTGDVRARSLVREALGEHSRAIVEEIPGPSPDDHTSDQTAEEIRREIRRLAAERAGERPRRIVAQFEQERGRATGLAVTGLASVLRALQLNQASTVLLRNDPASELRLWIGPEPAQLALTEEELCGIGAPVLGQDRADAALIRAIAGIGAELVLLPHPAMESEPDHAGNAGNAGNAAAGAPLPEGQPELADGIGALLRFTSPS
jgi:Bacterial archaeo-eukaryotic release factor family 2